MTKDVHVNSYTRSDGTEVKEHFRSAPNEGAAGDLTQAGTHDKYEVEILKEGTEDTLPDIRIEYIPSDDGVAPLLKGSISENVNSIPEKDVKQVKDSVIKAAKAIFTVISSATTGTLVSSNNQRKVIADSLNVINKVHQKSLRREDNLLDYMIKAKDKLEYSRLYKNYADLHSINQQNERLLNRIKYANEAGDYEIVVNDLQNYKNNIDEIVKSYNNQRSLIPKRKVVNHKNDKFDNFFANHPSASKSVVDIGMFLYNVWNWNKLNDTKELWKASSYNFAKSRNYIAKNGSLIERVSDLPDIELQNIVYNKLRSAGIDDSIGILYKSDSNFAKQAADSPEIRRYFLEHKDNLLNRQVVKNGSWMFNSNQNLTLGIRRFDIPYMYIGSDNNLYTVILDVYDFDNNDSDWKVRYAAYSQDAGYAGRYYLIMISKTPQKVWQKWIN